MLFVEADSLVDEIVFFPRIKLSKKQFLLLDGLETIECNGLDFA